MPAARRRPGLPRRCPACGADAVRPIAYGYPDLTLAEAADRGDVVLGGCIIRPDNPAWRCTACGRSGGPVEDRGESN